MKLLALVLALVLAPVAAGAIAGCVPACEVDASENGYATPITVLPSGQSVAWTSTDITHINSDVRLGGDLCFTTIAAGGETSAFVRFDLVDGALFATVDGETLPCATPLVTPAAAVIPYHCELHPTMIGVLVVIV
ncbi:MAG TPA: hypothetical protein VM370_13215 [Candidatus Thermoplasmatota archaeon]|nr:hypothetical protein [Candidatus Thermoplasmatota archaeon]